MMDVWAVAEHARVASGAAELAIFTAILYWFFTSSRVADMLEVVGERVGGWCGREPAPAPAPAPAVTLRAALRTRRAKHDVYAKLDADNAVRQQALYRAKEGAVVPRPQPALRPPAGLACARCAPLSRDSWQDPKNPDTGAVINILNIGRQTFANGGVVSRYLCDIAQCCHLVKFNYKDIVPSVVKDQHFQKAIEDATQEVLSKKDETSPNKSYLTVRKRIEAKAMKILQDISSAMSNNVLKLVAWLCHKAIRRVAIGCGTRAACIERLRRANAAGLPLVFVPLHRSHFDYILVTFTLYLTGIRPPLVAAGDNMRIPFFGWFLRGCGAFYIRRRVDGSEYHEDPIYKSALRAYILNSLAEHNNLEFFIEGGRTRTGKPQPPKAGILSVIMDAYLDGTIDDALLVPVTLNYDRLVDGNFVREQLGMPKQMETFWSALRGIWRTLNTNHGAIRVDFNQPSSLKELVQSFKKYNYMKPQLERSLSPPNNNLPLPVSQQLACSHSHSSLYGEGVSDEQKSMVEAIGRHLVYDASQATALMCTNVVSYVLLFEHRNGCTLKQLHSSVEARHIALARDGRDLYSGDVSTLVKHALDMLGRGLVRRDGGQVRCARSLSAAIELSYYANAVVAHYAAPAIMVTALETLVLEEGPTIRHDALMSRALQLCSILSHEFILCAPCITIEECMLNALDSLRTSDVLSSTRKNDGLEEERWCRRFAESLEEDMEEELRPDPTRHIAYTVSYKPEAVSERRRLLLSIRPLVEGYAATCRRARAGTQKEVVKDTLDHLTEEFTQNRMKYGEAVSVDAIRNCHRLLKQWGVIDIYTEERERRIRICPPYNDPHNMSALCQLVCQFNMDTPLLVQE